MKKIFLFVLLICSIITSGQIYQPALLFGKKENRINVLSTFHIPTGATAGLNSGVNLPGALFFQTSDNYFYMYNGTTWDKVAKYSDITGGGSTNNSIGSGYKIAVNGAANNIKSLFSNFGIILDSATTGQVGIKVDTTTTGLHTENYFNTKYSGINTVWNRNGNSGLTSSGYSSTYIGTNDSVPFIIKMNGNLAGYIGTSTDTRLSLGSRANELSLAGAGGNHALGTFALMNNTQGENLAGGLGAMMFNMGGWRNTIYGEYGMFQGHGTTTGSTFSEWNAGLGTFVLEVNARGSYNSALGGSVMRGNKDGKWNSALGYLALLYNSTVVERVIMTAGGNYTSLPTVTFSSPDPSTAGSTVVQATGHPVYDAGSSGSIHVVMDEVGKGYSHDKATVTATFSGGTSTVVATGIPILSSGDGNTGIGDAAGVFHIYDKFCSFFGYYAGYADGVSAYSDSLTLNVGAFSARAPYVPVSTRLINSSSIGPWSRVGCSDCLVLGDSIRNTKVGINTTSPRKLLDVMNGDILVFEKTIGRGNNSIATNTVFGRGALYNNTTGYNNTVVGDSSNYANTTAYNKTSLGFSSMKNSGGGGHWGTSLGAYNMFNPLSLSSGYLMTSAGFEGAYNGGNDGGVAIGFRSMYNSITGHLLADDGTSAVGGYSLYNNTTGVNNSAHGFAALHSNTTGSRNNGFGHASMGSGYLGIGTAGNTGNDNNAFGDAALFSSKLGSGSIALGTNALKIFVGSIGYNIAIGHNSNNLLVSGNYNVNIGGYLGTNYEYKSKHVFIGNGSTDFPYLVFDSLGNAMLGGTSGIATTSALLDLKSTTRGFLPPVMNTTQMTAIVSPATGLHIYNTDSLAMCWYDGSIWVKVGGSTGVGGSGETNTASNLGGGLANYSTKVGVDLRFNSFLATDFDLVSNVIGIDYANGQAATNSVPGFLTAADHTTFAAKLSNVLTTTGDIIYSSSGTTPARLGIGSTNDVLTVIGGVPTWQAASGGGANTALSNLASVSINTSLIPQTGINLGATATPFKDLYLYGSGTFGSHSMKFTGTPTGNRVYTFPDASITVARNDAAQTFTGIQTFNSQDKHPNGLSITGPYTNNEGMMMSYDPGSNLGGILLYDGGYKDFRMIANNMNFYGGGSNPGVSINTGGGVIIGSSDPSLAYTTRLGIAAGTTSVSPLKLNSGPLLTTPEAGTVGYNGTFYETKASGLRMALGGVVDDFQADNANVTNTETDLHSYTTQASTLGADGEKLSGIFTLVTTGLATQTVKVYFGGTVIFTDGLATTAGTENYSFDIIRVSSSVVRCVVNRGALSLYTEITGLTLSSTNILKITGQTVTSSSGAITIKMGKLLWHGVAAN